MLFQHTWEKVLSGEKTQTRRIVKPGDELFADDFDPDAVMRKGHSSYRKIFEVDSTYAVCPGRGKAQIARIRITNIRQDDVREISKSDIQAEGFGQTVEGLFNFLHTWISMHDKNFHFEFNPALVDYVWYTGKRPGLTGKSWGDSGGWKSLLEAIAARPAERYQSWALTFELVK